MSRESDRELLMAFTNYTAVARYVAIHEMIPGAAEQAIENFLAAREPQATERVARPLDTTLYHAMRGEPSAREGWVWVRNEQPDAIPAALPVEETKR